MYKKAMGFWLMVCGIGSLMAQQNDSIAIRQLNEVVVTDSRFELKRQNSGKTVVTISANELQNNQARSLVEVINSKSGIEINGSRGVAGQNLGYYVRGGNNRQVLILIDGIQINDPSQIANDFDLRLLDLNMIESVEIVKGAASTLYGNSAATAVINITTKKAASVPVALNVVSAMGSNRSQEQKSYGMASFTNNVSFSGTSGLLDYRLAFGNQFTDGISAFKGNNAESDAFSRINGNLKVGFRLPNRYSATFYGSFDDYKTDIDGFPPPNFTFDDTDDQLTTQQNRLALQQELFYGQGSAQLNLAYSTTTRVNRSTGLATAFDSHTVVLDFFNKYIIAEQWFTLIGVNHQKNEAFLPEEVFITNTDPYVNLVYVSKNGFNLNLGGRINHHSEYGSNVIYNINPSFSKPFKEGYAKWFGSYSTSFIAPSLFQLFDGFYGNRNLDAETNRTLETGLEWNNGNGIRASALYFNRNEENTVQFVLVDPANFGFQYVNAPGAAAVQGVELELESQPFEKLSFSVNYSFTELKEGFRVRLPKHRANLSLAYLCSEQTYVSLAYQWVGSRLDTDFSTFQDVRLKPYSLLDLYASHQLKNNRMKLFMGITNVLNTDFVEVLGFTTRGRNFNVGLNLNL